MIINACGGGCFKIQTGGVTLMTEPFEEDLSNRFKPDILLKNRYNLSAFGAKSDYFIIEGPGEYEIKGIEVTGFQKGVYLVKAEEMKLGFVAPVALGKDSFEIAEQLEDVDILFIPVTEQSEKIIKQLEPKIVVPASADYQQLLKAFNQKAEPQEKLTIKKKEVPASGPQIVLLAN